MDTIENISFDLPTWLVVYYHCIGTVSLVLNCGTIFLVIFKSDTIDNFRYCILIFQILCTITDVHLTFLMEPIPLFPIIAGYCAGFLAQYANVWSHYLMAFMVSLMSAQIEFLVYCFMKKHQTLAKILCRHVCSEKLFLFGELGLPVLPFLVYIAYCKAGMERNDQLSYVKELYPHLLSGFSSLPNFAIYTLNFWFILMAVVSILGGIFCGCVFVLSTMDMFKMLRGVQRKISMANYKRHQAAVKSLLAQFAVTSLCLCPPFLFVVVIMSKFKYAQVTVQFLLAIFACHSSVNAIVLVVTTPPYRNYVMRKPTRSKFVVNVSVGAVSTF